MLLTSLTWHCSNTMGGSIYLWHSRLWIKHVGGRWNCVFAYLTMPYLSTTEINSIHKFLLRIYGFTYFTVTLCCKAEGSAAYWRRRSNSLTCHTSPIHVHSSSHCHTCCIYTVGGRHFPALCCQRCHKPQRRRCTRSFSVSTQLRICFSVTAVLLALAYS